MRVFPAAWTPSILVMLLPVVPAGMGQAEPIPGTQLLPDGDLDSQMLDGIDRFLDRHTAGRHRIAPRPSFWKRDISSPARHMFNRSHFQSPRGWRSCSAWSMPARATSDAPKLDRDGESTGAGGQDRPAYEDLRRPLAGTGRRVGGGAAAQADRGRRWRMSSRSPMPIKRRRSLCGLSLRRITGRIAIRPATGRGAAAGFWFRRSPADPIPIRSPPSSRARPIRAIASGSTARRSRWAGTIGYEIQKVLAAVDWFERDSAWRTGRIGRSRSSVMAKEDCWPFTAARSTRASCRSVSAVISIPGRTSGRSRSIAT